MHVDPVDSSPLGENETHAEVTCWSGPNDELVCNEASGQARVGEPYEFGPPVQASADCKWLSVDEGSLCGSLRVRGEANHADRSVNSQLKCGGGFGTQCPSAVSTTTAIDDGEAIRRVSVFADSSRVGLCVTGQPADVGCVAVPP